METIKRPNINMGLVDGLGAWRIWTLLAYQDIVQRFRNSVLGPLWMLANLGVILGGISILYSEMLNQSIQTFVPYLSVSLVLLNLIWPTILESCHAFAAYPDIIRQVRMPLSALIMRTIYRNIIVTAHNLIIILIVFIAFKVWQNIKVLETLGGIILLFGNLGWISIICAIAGARFRDMIQITSSLLNVLALFTPIYWVPALISKNRIFLDINPFYHIIELVRQPMLGQHASQLNWIVCGAMMVFGWAIALILFNATKKKIAFWV